MSADTVTPADNHSLAGPTVTQIEDITQDTQNTQNIVNNTNDNESCEKQSPYISSISHIKVSFFRDLCLYLKRVVFSHLTAHNISNVHNCMRILKFSELVMPLKSHDPGGFWLLSVNFHGIYLYREYLCFVIVYILRVYNACAALHLVTDCDERNNS